jgi:hypothetical protein
MGAALETAIKDSILADAAIVAFVGERVRPLGMAADDDRPYLTYLVTGRTTNDTLASGPADYRKAEFDIGVYADDYADVMDISDLLRDRLDGFGGTVAGVELDVDFDGETDIEEVVPDGEELPIYLRMQTYRTLYKVTA